MGFPIVGIGASAGGLGAFMQLFSKMPTDTGMAFILIQHLDPTQQSLSAEIIARISRLPVQEATHKMLVKPNQVYIIPPNRSMTIVEGVLHLLLRPPEQHMTIDLFFESLAKDKRTKAIAVVMSGTGADGTLGLKAIKAEGGITVAQDPKSAKYPGMPQRAIESGMVDLILEPKMMVEEFKKMVTHPYINRQTIEKTSNNQADEPIFRDSEKNLRKIFNLLRAHSNIDFTGYKKPTIERRIQRRMMLQKITDLEVYAKYLSAHPEDIKSLYYDILISVTEFFRDPESFKILTKSVFPKMIKNRDVKQPIRIWIPGCSTGEEAYSIAISLTEYLEKMKSPIRTQIFATDINEQSIQKARLGKYPESILRNVSSERLKRFFYKTSDGYKVHKTIRDICIFSKHNMIEDPPFTKIDLLSCRNVLIYFSPLLQKRILPMFHYALRTTGYLWLGKSETPGEFMKLFKIIDKSHKAYAKLITSIPMNFRFRVQPNVVELPEMESKKESTFMKMDFSFEKARTFNKISSDFEKDTDKIILSKFAPPSVIVNSDMEILQFRGRIIPYLEPSLSNNIFKMTRPELVAGLRMIIQSAKTKNRSVKKEGLHFEVDGKHKTVTIEVLPINPLTSSKERIFLIFFHEVAALAKVLGRKKPKSRKDQKNDTMNFKDQQIAELLSELSDSKDYQQSLIEQYETTQEELTSLNEELQSTNEELQTINEEVETAKEELQSTNEELVTVNEELLIRNTDLVTVTSDLSNLLSSTEIPILMVGNDKRIRHFTPNAEIAFNLLHSDVGRKVDDIKIDFGVNLEAMITEVTEHLLLKEIEVQDRNGLWRRLQIRPYKTIDNKIDGAIIALIDIEELKQKEKKSAEAFDYVTSIADTVPFPLIVVDHSLRIKSANQAFYEYFQLSNGVLGVEIFVALGMTGEYLSILPNICSEVVISNTSFVDFNIDYDFPRIGYRNLLLSGKKIHWRGVESEGLLLSFADITKQIQIQRKLDQLYVLEQKARGDAEKANNAKDIFLATLSHELRTPLSSILTWAQLIHMGKVNAKKAREGASIIERSAKTQSQLIADLLDISRIIAGKLALIMQEVSPADVTSAAVESVRPLAEAKSITIETVVNVHKGIILADPIRVQQVIWNLLTNAIKFSRPKGKVEIRLNQIEIQGKHAIQIKVTDYGKGISPEFLPNIFDRFSQADSTSTRNYGGLGLGLSIVRNLVEMQQGNVQAESEGEGLGAVFTVTFPLILHREGETVPTDFSGAELQSPLIKDNEQRNIQRLKELRILLVDDDSALREALRISLKISGASVRTAKSAKMAWHALKVFKPHVLVSDIAMPKEDGYSLMRKIRSLSRELGGDTPAVALTAYAGINDVTQALEAGFHSHIAKPFETEELINIILKLAEAQRDKPKEKDALH